MFHNIITSMRATSINFQLAVRYYAAKKRPIPIDKKLTAVTESLAARGFLRPTKAYSPPQDVESCVHRICEEHGVSSSPDTQLSSADSRFAVLRACFTQFQHGVPNSLLHTIDTVGDILKFYKTEVVTTTPLEALKTMDLPKNLHIQYDAHRFHPDTETLFKGKSAFPKSSTIVSGLKYKKKYQGHKAKRSWP